PHGAERVPGPGGWGVRPVAELAHGRALGFGDHRTEPWARGLSAGPDFGGQAGGGGAGHARQDGVRGGRRGRAAVGALLRPQLRLALVRAVEPAAGDVAEIDARLLFEGAQDVLPDRLLGHPPLPALAGIAHAE